MSGTLSKFLGSEGRHKADGIIWTAWTGRPKDGILFWVAAASMVMAVSFMVIKN